MGLYDGAGVGMHANKVSSAPLPPHARSSPCNQGCMIKFEYHVQELGSIRAGPRHCRGSSAAKCMLRTVMDDHGRIDPRLIGIRSDRRGPSVLRVGFEALLPASAATACALGLRSSRLSCDMIECPARWLLVRRSLRRFTSSLTAEMASAVLALPLSRLARERSAPLHSARGHLAPSPSRCKTTPRPCTWSSATPSDR